MNPYFQNRRHNSVLSPTEKPNLHSPLKSGENSTSSSLTHNTIRLRSNSIFAYQEFDQYSSFFESPQSFENFQINSPKDEMASFCGDQDSFSDSSKSSEKSPHNSIKPGKRFSDGNVYLKSSKLFMNNTEMFPNIGYMNYNNQQQLPQNMYQNPILSGQNNPGQFQSDFRRNSLGLIPNFNFNILQQKKIMSFIQNQQQKNNYNAFQMAPNYPIQIPKTNNKRQVNDDKFILENLNSLLQDQIKCRMVQDKLEEKKNNEEFMQLFYDLTETNIVDIINHQFGNYVIQKFFEILVYQKNKNLISQFFSKIQSDLFKISVNNYGTRVFQKSLEKMDGGNYLLIQTQALDDIIKNLIEKHLFALCYDKNGNHVFQKIVRMFPQNKNDFIFIQLNQYAVEISKLKQGVSILQTSLKYANESQKQKLIHQILSEISSLINDEYGNYIIQFIVELREKEFNDFIYEYISKNVVSLSKKKFSSNVIDKCIIQDDSHSYNLINYLINNKLIREMITDQYGNYVVQKALNITNGYLFMTIIHQIQPALDTLKRSNIGRQIYDHLIRKYGDYFANSNNSENIKENENNKNNNNK